MFNVNSKKYPVYKDFNTHTLSSNSGDVLKHFFAIQELPPSTPIPVNYELLDDNTPIILLEEKIGYKGLWNRIKVKDGDNYKIGYVKSVLKPISGSLPFHPVNLAIENLPNYSAAQIDWINQPPGVVYDDVHNACYAVHYELEDVTSVEDRNTFNNSLRRAYLEGSKLILEEKGFSSNEIDNLLNNYYIFSRAEEWYINPRPCSTLRVLVAIPKKYVNYYLNRNVINKISNFKPKSPTKKYKTKTFNNYFEYKEFFDSLTTTLKHYNTGLVGRTWELDPDYMTFNLAVEAENVMKLEEKIILFLKQNIPSAFVNTQRDLLFTSKEIWLGSLELVFDELCITEIKFKTFNNNKLNSLYEIVKNRSYEDLKNNYINDLPDTDAVFNTGVTSFLKDAAVLDKTNVYYLLNFNPSDDSVAIIDNLLDVNYEKKIETFLVEKHYPSIFKFEFKPLNLIQCSVDNAMRLNNLAQYKLPSEIEKFKRVRQRAVDNQIKNEGDPFSSAFVDLNTVVDPNMRVLLGLDLPRGKTAKEKLMNYIIVAKRIDWGKFLAISSACMAKYLSPEEYRQLLDSYQNAKKYLDTLAANSICNPYLTNALKTINMVGIPEFPVISQNASLVKQIENAIIQMVMDLLQQTIKSALINAAKACLSDPNADYTDNSPQSADEVGDFLNNNSNNNVNNLLNDLGDSSLSPDKVKNDLISLIDDLSSCLTPKEMCKLFSNTTLNDDVMQIIITLVKRKYPEYSNKLNDKKSISNLFLTLGNNIDLTICRDLINSDTPSSADSTSVICDGEKINNIREALLKDKGLDQELIDDLLNQIKQKEKKNLEDVFKLLSSDKPFDISLAPNVLCNMLPDEALGTFDQDQKNSIDSIFNSMYSIFDEEALEWHKITYSTKKQNKTIIEWDSNNQTFKIPPPDSNAFKQQGDEIKKLNDPDKSKDINIALLDSSVNDKKIPFYLFKYGLRNSSYEVYDDKNNFYLYNKIDGDLEQRLNYEFKFTGGDDLNNLRQNVLNLNSNSTNQTEGIIPIIHETFKYVDDYLRDNNITLQQFYEIKGNIIDKVLLLFDGYINDNTYDFYENRKKYPTLYKYLNISRSNIANSFFFNFEGISTLSAISELLDSNDTLKDFFFFSVGGKRTLFVNSFFTAEKYYNTIYSNLATYNVYETQYLNSLQENLILKKNNKNFINIKNTEPIDQNIQNYIFNDLNLSLSNLNKQDVFVKFINNKKSVYPVSGEQIDTSSSPDLKQTFKYFNDSIIENLLSVENKFCYLKEQSKLNTSSPDSQTIFLSDEGYGRPYTKLLKLVINQTMDEKSCDIKPNYLDIDLIKKDALSNKNNCSFFEVPKYEEVSSAPEAVLNYNFNYILKPDEIYDIPQNSKQKNILNSLYTLFIRTYVHEAILKAASLFSFYDPQSFKNNNFFYQLLTDLVENEMRFNDNKTFELMMNFYGKNNTLEQRRGILKQKIVFELNNYVLPKITKRVDQDTNNAIMSEPNEVPISLVDFEENIKNNKCIELDSNCVYLIYYSNNIKTKQKIYQTSDSNVWNSFKNSNEYKLLFNFLIPHKHILAYFFALSYVSINANKNNTKPFINTKRALSRTVKNIVTKGFRIASDPLDAQDTVLSDANLDLIKFILKSMITTPIKILKGVAETTEPNLSLVSKLYLGAKTLNPDLSSVFIPAVSIPLGLPTPVSPPILPFVNLPLALAYFGSLAWFSDDISFNLDSSKEAANNALNKNVNGINCEQKILSNRDSTYFKSYTTKNNSVYSNYKINNILNETLLQYVNRKYTSLDKMFSKEAYSADKKPPNAIWSDSPYSIEFKKIESLIDVYSNTGIGLLWLDLDMPYPVDGPEGFKSFVELAFNNSGETDFNKWVLKEDVFGLSPAVKVDFSILAANK